MSFSLEYDGNYNVLLVSFSGTLTREEHQAMVATVRQFVAHHGPCHAIADFGADDDFKLDLDYIKNLAQSPAVLFGQMRVLVAQTTEIFGTMRLFDIHQSETVEAPLAWLSHI